MLRLKTLKNNIYPVFALTFICIVTAVLLSFVNTVTAPIIESSQMSGEDMARSELLPNADSFTKLDLQEIDGLSAAYRADNGAGYVFTTTANGFGGEITVLTAISEGKICGVRMTQHNETSGYGSRAADDNYDYTSQYKNVGKDLEGIKIISGSTVTSKAFEKAVKIAFDAYGRIE